jgi:SMC interacting uncharacterized protein involved in chromosome segregation
MATEKAKQIVGKQLSEGAYLSPETLRECYKSAMADTCFTNGNGKLKKEVEETKGTVEQLLKMLTQKDEEIKTLKATIDDKFEQLRREFFAETVRVKSEVKKKKET